MTRTIALVLATALLGSACENTAGGDLDRTVARVEISAPAGALEVGQSLQLTATPRSGDGAPVAAAVTWSSSDTSVAAVSPAGEVKGMGAGTARITASAQSREGQVVVTVNERPISWVEITPGGDLVQPAGSSRQLGVVLHAQGGAELPPRPAIWSSSNEAIASVTAGGVVQAHATGVATITATVDGKAGQKVVMVPSEVALVELDRLDLALAVGDDSTLAATVRNAAGATLQRVITWSSANSAVASVDQNGRVTGRGAGRTTITAEVEGKRASAPVVVGEWSTRTLVAVNSGVLPETISAGTRMQNGVAVKVEYRVTEGRFRTLSGTGLFELTLNGWMMAEGQAPVQAVLGTSGTYLYDLTTSEMVLHVPGHFTFRGEHTDEGLVLRWKPLPEAPQATLLFRP